MNSADYVTALIKEQKEKGIPLQTVAWNAALACVGWSYVFGARWQYCTPANRRARYSEEHPTIKTACKNYSGSGSANCVGCKWYPNSHFTRINDCRGFTYGILKAVYDGWELIGAGCTTQWNTEKNWTAKGDIKTMPSDTLVCLFVKKGNKMEHTGFGFNNETVECSSGVQHFTSRNKKWTHWGLPKCVSDKVPEIPTNSPALVETRPTLKRGSKGEYVVILQKELIQLGYSVGATGVDGDFGKNTEAGVKKFQKDHALAEDGIVGKNTWEALDKAMGKPLETAPVVEKKYKVVIPHLDEKVADELIAKYSGATKSEE